MKKQFLLLGLAVAAMTSCTNDEVLDVQQPVQKAIGFEGFVNKGTRVAVDNEVTADNLSRFYVFGYHDGDKVYSNGAVVEGVTNVVFDNVSVIRKEVNSEISWDVNAVRDWQTQKYYFAAYADGTGVASHAAPTLQPSFSSATLTFSDYTVSSTPANHTDLIAAVTEERNNTSSLDVSKVSLDFKHLLSKVNFKFSNTNTNNLKMEVSDVSFKVYTKADCSYKINNTTWSDWTEIAEYNIDKPHKGTSVNKITLNLPNEQTKEIESKYLIERGNESDTSIEYFVIPGQTLENDDAGNPIVGIITYTVAYYDTDNNQVEQYTQSLSLFPTSLAWQPSYIYNYDVELPASPKKIEFTVNSVGTWTSSGVPLDGSKSN